MQKHEVILNRSFIGVPIGESSLKLQNNYYVYTQSLGGGLTSEFNIRAYLTNPNNQNIVDQFIEYIESNTTQEQFLEIYYDDKKLKDVFNEFFETTIQAGQVTATAVIDRNLENTITITIQDNWWNWDGENNVTSMSGISSSINNASRQNNFRNELTSITSEDSYYIPVIINANVGLLPSKEFSICKEPIDIRLNPLEFYMANQGIEVVTPTVFINALNLLNNSKPPTSNQNQSGGK